MGKKISVDSATMMNKVFEIIEAKKIFNIKYEALDILVQPSSYVHAIIKFNDGMVKIIAHDTNMRIPIFNSLYENQNKKIKTDKLNLKKLNLLNLKKVDLNKFPSIKIIKKLKNKESSLETVIVLANDILVNHFLLKKIYFTDITKFLQKLISMKKFKNYSNNKLDNINSIVLLNNQIRTTINKMIT
jgi:1-deoxy-D-xylulose-5-phosphate reductoisomerase